MPSTMVRSDFGSFQLFASSLISAALALPSSGGAVTPIFRLTPPASSSISP
jgi:hypothetical protein